MERRRASKLLALVLRHDPGRFGVHLDERGWADVGELLAALAAHGAPLTREELAELATPRPGEKQRFELAGARVRARYGHSVPVDPGYPPAQPPAVLYHGTARRSVAAILAAGIQPRGRRMVHLSEDPADARTVGARHGAPAVLTVDAAAMAAGGHLFHVVPGGVWLTDRVPPEHLSTSPP